MALTNSSIRYGAIAKTFHWLTALLILSLIPIGWYAERLPFVTDAELARKAWLFSLHKTLGVTVFFVAAVRIIWAIIQPKPKLLNADHKFESFAAETVHWALYGALVIVPLSGWISHAAAAGYAPIWWPFGQGLPLVSKSTTVEHVFGAVHWISGKVLIAALFLHIAGALKHHVIDRDATLRRMLPGTPTLGPLPPQQHSNAPIAVALVIWASVLVAGTVMGASNTEKVDAPELAEVASDWIVQDGQIEITIVQFGSEVSGQFSDWTAAITFDETSTDVAMGNVTTTIAIPSLTLGSVTEQAMGADFFDAENYPTAVFMADIKRGVDGYDAVGTLTIRDQTMPLILPFSLTIREDTAEMLGHISLDRRDFAVGDNMTDTGSLAFEVDVTIKLTATKDLNR
jgi:cytochrome b561/polyisoprenoid-binding protein YceI